MRNSNKRSIKEIIMDNFTYVYPNQNNINATITIGSIIAWIVLIAGIVIGSYLLYLIIKALRIYIKKNS
jgi:acyl-CoA hydrolase